MTGLDTNVLVRFLVGDDERQCELATAAIKNVIVKNSVCHINSIVLCELIWVLESAYGYNREEIADVIEKVLAARQFHIGQKDLIYLAMRDFRQGKADFSDYLIGRINRAAACSVTITFDKTLKDDTHFKLLS